MSAGTRSSAITATAPADLGDPGLLAIDDVHDDAAFEHLGESPLDAVGAVLDGRFHGSISWLYVW